MHHVSPACDWAERLHSGIPLIISIRGGIRSLDVLRERAARVWANEHDAPATRRCTGWIAWRIGRGQNEAALLDVVVAQEAVTEQVNEHVRLDTAVLSCELLAEIGEDNPHVARGSRGDHEIAPGRGGHRLRMGPMWVRCRRNRLACK